MNETTKVKKIHHMKATENIKEYVIVEFEDGKIWYPKMKDLGIIIKGIYDCEDKKYPRGDGGGLFWKFLYDIVHSKFNTEYLIKKYKLPNEK